MGKIIILVGSMRKGGNTDLLARSFAEGAAQNNEVELVPVGDYKVNPCIGCNACYVSAGNRCPQKDDMAKIFEKLETADILVVATPVYFYGVSAQLKAVIDRLHSPMRNRFKLKKLALLAVGADSIPTIFDALLMQYRLILSYFHLEDAGTVLVNGVQDKGDILNKKDALERAYNLGLSMRMP